MQLWPHHERAIASLLVELRDNPDALALVLGGSLARGWGRENSDLDGHLLVTEAAMQRRIETNGHAFIPAQNHCDYEGGYVDLKAVSMSLLEDAAVRASEPFRNAFIGVEIVWTREGTDEAALRDVMQRAAAYPEAGHAEKVRQFAAHLRGMHWYVGEATKRNNGYLMLWCTQRVILLASRLVLAENRVLYPYHKWMLQTVADCEHKPEGFLEAVDAAVASPGVETTRKVAELVDGWRTWGPDEPWWEPWISRSEWAWRIEGQGAMGIDDV
ncbi:MAG: hypothetical protein AAF916_09165 [Planctomycetota bacterium]